ncbi:relaxase/mobilization nuclease domain-containing protein [Chryseobacterium sp. Ch-15]|uniref:Relaxase/mobilization nuclease domain-containing protein n=1 Tax=Chryseobacterium muglaense TaxID=2893752 RepID=A0A9Q3YTJ0_9FLAO|nr:conjugal transfer protein MobB [Chryseobacterium muglaense]MBD3905396.1 relaxase/mobilization nuclease domain-containing protein [Chryseobacterium muglaense]MCC9036879.1 relaxase/mobilization nuclease domain-containing protein [Chryseobacterium muglaense]MCM2555259.1 relaxase/mobilization nuclease domain-containing protein [Chryseobacterium muglaense]
MIAKIGKSENLWSALTYNQQKVDSNNGTVLFTNKIPDLWDRPYSVKFFQRYFEPYLVANNKTEKPVRHISLNPDPDDKVDDSNYREMAQQYMNETGYGNQPYVVFKHTDIDRTHIHIVTTCVQLDGKKISDSYDHPRSMEICRQLEKQYNLKIASENKNSNPLLNFKPVDIAKGNIKAQLSSILRHIPRTYGFQSIGAYNTLLSQFNITLEEVNGELHGKMRKGIVYFVTDENGKKISLPFKSSLFGKHAGSNNIQAQIQKSKVNAKNKLSKQILKTTVETAVKTSNSEATFKKQLLEQRIAVVIRKNDQGRIYGITFIDHISKSVWNGSQLSKDLSANSFHQHWNHFENKPHVKSHTPKNNDSQQRTTAMENIVMDDNKIFDGLFSDFLSSDANIEQEEQIFESQMKKKQRKRRKKI